MSYPTKKIEVELDNDEIFELTLIRNQFTRIPGEYSNTDKDRKREVMEKILKAIKE